MFTPRSNPPEAKRPSRSEATLVEGKASQTVGAKRVLRQGNDVYGARDETRRVEFRAHLKNFWVYVSMKDETKHSLEVK